MAQQSYCAITWVLQRSLTGFRQSATTTSGSGSFASVGLKLDDHQDQEDLINKAHDLSAHCAEMILSAVQGKKGKKFSCLGKCFPLAVVSQNAIRRPLRNMYLLRCWLAA